MVTTPNKGMEQQPYNNPNWNVPNNSNFDIIDAALGNVALINVTAVGTSPVALTQTQYKCLGVSFSGTLSNNVNYQLPSGVQGHWFIKSSATGAFTITISSAGGGSSVAISPGIGYSVYCDSTGVALMNISGTTALAVTDWDQALLYKNTYLSGDIATSLLASGYEGQTGGSGRAGVGVYYAVDGNNGVLVVHAYPGNNRWQRMYVAGVWQPWSKIPNSTEIVRRDFKLTGNANTTVSGATTPGADFYLIDTGSSNIPSWAAVNDTLISYNVNTTNGTQLVISRSGKAAVRGVTAGVWTNWVDIHNYARFESGQISYVNDGTGTVAHGLGSVPRNISVYAVCITAQSSLVVGDRMRVTSQIQIKADATNITYRVIGTGLSDMTAGNTAVNLTPANFRLVFTAEL